MAAAEVELERLLIKVLGDSTDFQRMIGSMQKSMDQAEQNMRANVGSMLAQVAPMAQRISNFFRGTGQSAVMAAGKFEQTTIAFETMLGSASKTSQLLSDLTTFAAKTPFEMPEIEQAARGLVQFGERGDQLMETLNILGNAAAGTSTSFGMVSLIFNQIRGVGKLLTQDFRQLSTRGILSLQDLADHFGVTTAEAQKMLSAGKISFEDVREVFKSLSAEGGRFANLMERQSQSLLGVWSTLKDNVNILSREFGERWVPSAKSVVTWLNNMVESTRELSPGVRNLIADWVGYVTVGSTVIAQGASIGMTLSSLITGYNAMTQAISAATVAKLRYTAAIGGIVVVGAIAVRTLLSMTEAARGLADAEAKINEQEELRAKLQEKIAGGNRSEDQIEKDRQRVLREIETKQRAIEKARPRPARLYHALGGVLNIPGVADAAAELFGFTTTVQVLEKDLAKSRKELQAYNDELLKAQNRAKGAGDMWNAPVPSEEELLAMKKYSDELEKQLKFGTGSDALVNEFESKFGTTELVAEIRERQRLIEVQEEERRKKEELKAAQERLVADTKNLTKSLEEQIAVFGMTSTEAEIYRLIQRGASEEELKRAKALGEQLEKMKKQKKAEEEAKNEMQKLIDQGKRLKEQFLTPLEQFQKKKADLDKLLSVGAIDKNTHTRALEEAQKEFRKTTAEAEAYQRALQGLRVTAVRGGTAEFTQAQEVTRTLVASLEARKAENQPQPNRVAQRPGFGSRNYGGHLSPENEERKIKAAERTAEAVEKLADGRGGVILEVR